MTLNLEQARRNMIANQVRAWDVVNMEVLDTLGRVHREDFVPAAYRNMAFVDMAVPLGHGEVMMKPVVEGRVLQALALDGNDRVLEIGTGSGYLAACMAQLAAHVTSVELHRDFTQAARQHLTAAGIDNVTLETGDAVREYTPSAQYDAVVVTGATPDVLERFLDWLNPGGRAFMVTGHSPVMRAVLVRRDTGGQWHERSLFETDLPYLVHAAPAPAFSL